MSETDDSDKTDEVKEKLGDGETLGGTTDDSDMVLTLDSDDEDDDE
jgi:hypothetical protein